MNVFVKPDKDQLIEIVLEYYESPSGRITVVEDDGTRVKYGDKVQKITTWWKDETWRSNNDMTREAMTYNSATGQPSIDFTRISEYKLHQCLIKWDITDEDDMPVPCTNDMKDCLKPIIGNTLVARYNNLTLLSEEDLGN